MADALPSTNVRLDCAKWFVDRLRTAYAALAAAAAIETGREVTEFDVEADVGWPGDALYRRHVWCDEITGMQTLPVMVAGRRQRDDRFRIPLEIRCLAPTMDEAYEVLSVLVSIVEDVLAEAHTLDDEVPGILSAEMADERTLIARTPDEGARGYARVTLAIHARLG